MSDLFDLYSETKGLKSGVKRSLSALRAGTDGRLVRLANVACSSNEVSFRRPWRKRGIASGEAGDARPCEICGSEELLTQ